MIEIECEGTKEQMIAMVRQEKEGLLIERIPEDVVKQIKNQKQIVRALKLVFGTTIAVTLIGIVIGPVFDFIDLSIYGALTIGAAYTISRMEKMLGRSICMQPATNVLRVMEEMGKRIGETLQDMEKHLEAGL